jgi:multiple sugar transport system ATP-binding protein
VRRELKVLQREFGYTTIVVTHDQVEALSLADRLAVMDGGVVQQFGTPDEVFDDPANLFVAEFVGEPQINVLPGVVRVDGGRARVEIGSGAGSVETAVTGVADGTHVTVGIRPQDCALSARGGGGIEATVAYFEHLLEFGLATSTVSGIEEGIVVQTPAEQTYESEQQVTVTAAAERVYLFDKDSGERLR